MRAQFAIFDTPGSLTNSESRDLHSLNQGAVRLYRLYLFYLATQLAVEHTQRVYGLGVVKCCIRGGTGNLLGLCYSPIFILFV